MEFEMFRQKFYPIAAVSALLFSAACGGQNEEAQGGAAAAEMPNESGVNVAKGARPFTYTCNDGAGFTLYVLPETAWVRLPNRTVRLPRDVAKTGTRYSNGSIDFTLKNGVAEMDTEERMYTGCRSSG
jgi:hypothetical protein